ncbi:Oxidoreductase FAD-binding domain protein [Methylobacterium sp. 4-46]|uniref:FAD-binding oxidoreductase n=1 Tax=unclassified Methylobacterium TaxID=2615210 RepID=UPI000152CCBF|nr:MULTISPECIES: FAD-binding oxidoreductase [unclassified Methylobacterium]ACA18812.1 Oxidoreductase FAD-binding domain protein [Methylobacterium sp. 4-46]
MVLAWQEAVITGIAAETPRVKRFTLRPDRPFAFRAGQHVDVRLTAPDGYQAQRSYSIASAPGSDAFDLMIERLDAGEVSTFFADVAEAGDRIELRGPIGAFAWGAGEGGPLLLVGGGSGVVPLLSMLRHRAAAAPGVPALLVYSARTPDEVIAREELLRRDADEPHFQLMLTLTRVPGGRRLDAARVAEALARLGPPAHAFVCGGNPFVSAASDLLIDAGVARGLIRTERFGG